MIFDTLPNVVYLETMSNTPKSFSDQIRAAVDASDLTRYRICKNAGIDHGAFSNFMAGRRGMSLESLDRLTAVLGLRVTTGRRTRK